MSRRPVPGCTFLCSVFYEVPFWFVCDIIDNGEGQGQTDPGNWNRSYGNMEHKQVLVNSGQMFVKMVA